MPNFSTSIFSQRYSCRAYAPRAVGRESVLRILEAARLAPSAVNRQPWTFLVVDDESGRRSVIDAYDREWVRSAPLFIIVIGHHDQAWHRQADAKDHTDIDCAIAAEHICLAATAEELATCWVCNFDPVKLRAAFDIPDSAEPIAVIPLGYPAEGSKTPDKVRKPLDQIVKWNRL